MPDKEEKELACVICPTIEKGSCRVRPRIIDACKVELAAARRVLAAGYRKIDLEKLTP